jgi:hypothetical protein
VLILDDADVPPVIQAGDGVVVHRAHGILQAGALLANERPNWLVVNPKCAWHRRVLAVIPREARPAVIGVGDAWGDDIDARWLPSSPLAAVLERARQERLRRATPPEYATAA